MANKLVRKFKSCIHPNLTNSYENIWPSKKCSNKLQYRFKKNISVQPFAFGQSSVTGAPRPFGEGSAARAAFKRIKIQFHSVCRKHYVSKKMNLKNAAPLRPYHGPITPTPPRGSLTSFRRAFLGPIAALEARKRLDCVKKHPEGVRNARCACAQWRTRGSFYKGS